MTPLPDQKRWTEITLTSEQSFALPDSSCRGCRGEDKHASLLRDQIPLNPPIFPLLGGGLEVGGGSVSTSPPLLSFHGDVTGICECQGAARADLSLGWDGTAGGFIFPRVHLHRKPSVLRIEMLLYCCIRIKSKTLYHLYILRFPILNVSINVHHNNTNNNNNTNTNNNNNNTTNNNNNHHNIDFTTILFFNSCEFREKVIILYFEAKGWRFCHVKIHCF